MNEYRLYLTSLLDGLARSGVELPDYSLETIEDLWEVASWLDKVYTFVQPLYQEGDLTSPYEFSLTDSFYEYWRAEFYKEHLGREAFSTPSVSVEPSTDTMSLDSLPPRITVEEVATSLSNTGLKELAEEKDVEPLTLSDEVTDEDETSLDLEPLSFDLTGLDLGIYEPEEEEITLSRSPITGVSLEGFDLYGEPLEGSVADEEEDDEDEDEDDFDYSYEEDEIEDPSLLEDLEDFVDLEETEEDTWGYEEYLALDEEEEEDFEEDEDDTWGYEEYLSEEEEEGDDDFIPLDSSSSDSSWLYEELPLEEGTSEAPVSSSEAPKVNILEEHKNEPDEPSKLIKGHPERVLHLLGKGEASLKKFVKERWNGSDRL